MKKLLLLCLLAVVALAFLACGGSPTPAGSAAAKVKDPVCGMEIDPAKSVKIERDGKAYYFCSAYCKEQFEKNPAKFTQPK